MKLVDLVRKKDRNMKWRTEVHRKTCYSESRNYGGWDGTVFIFVREISRDEGNWACTSVYVLLKKREYHTEKSSRKRSNTQ